MSTAKSLRICSRCHVAEAHNCAYCIECKRIVQRARYARLRAGGKSMPTPSKAKRALNPDACNCGDATCDGLRCEVVRA